MIIYQLHKYSGEWEDFRDRIVGSYLRKERAIEEKNRLEAEESKLIEQSRKCGKCPYLYDYFIANEKLLEYCSNAKLEEYDDDIDCDNYYQHYDEATFKIEEVEVEE